MMTIYYSHNSLDDEKERSDGLQNLVLVHKNNFLVDAVVVDVSSQVVEIERLTNLVSEWAWNRHGLHGQGHGCAALHITKLEKSGAHASISVEKS